MAIQAELGHGLSRPKSPQKRAWPSGELVVPFEAFDQGVMESHEAMMMK